MAALILPHRWRQQPQGPVEIDWNHPLAEGLAAFVYTGMGVPVEVISGLRFTAFGSAGMGVYSGGRAAKVDDLTSYWGLTLPAPITAGTDNLTWFCESTSTVVTGTRRRIARYSSGANFVLGTDYETSTRMSAGVRTSTGSFPVAASDSGYAPYKRELIVGTHTWEPTITRIYRNGVNSTDATFSQSGNTPLLPIDEIIFAGNAASGTGFTSGFISSTGVYKRILSQGEISALAENQYQMLRPLKRKMYVLGATTNVPETVLASTLEFAQTTLDVQVNEVTALPVTTLEFTQTDFDIRVNETLVFPVDALEFTQTLNGVQVNERTAIMVDQLVLTQTPFAVNVNEVTVLPVDTLEFTQTAFDVTVNGSVVFEVDTLAFAQTELGVKLNERTPVDALDVAQTSFGVKLNERMPVEALGFTHTGLDVKLSEAINASVLVFSQQMLDVDVRRSVTVATQVFTQTMNDVNVVERFHVPTLNFTQALDDVSLPTVVDVEGLEFVQEMSQFVRVAEAVRVTAVEFVQTMFDSVTYIDYEPAYKVTMTWKQWATHPDGGVYQKTFTETFNVPLRARLYGSLPATPTITGHLPSDV